ncbi:MAG: hypothetical protein JSV86_05535 [Gemmatimonadota bacterium]|nr:MAG: hypothetical protein JSV86_05535 [Gemmatimonadota bacterium]
MTGFGDMDLGDKLPNGSTLIRWGTVAQDTGQVIVLATWRHEFVTWQANMNDTRTTGWGHYFPFGKYSGTTVVDALLEAWRDYHARLVGMSGGQLRCPPTELVGKDNPVENSIRHGVAALATELQLLGLIDEAA